MPTISYFFGIAIRMYYREHPPAHFHALYQGAEAIYDIASGAVLQGRLPPAGDRLVKEWLLKSRAQLLENWERARNYEPLERIPGLDAD